MITDEESEMVQRITTLVTTPVSFLSFIDISRSNSLIAFQSFFTAYVLRFIHNSRQCIPSRIVGPLSTLELRAANLKWLYSVQHTIFSAEIQNLQSCGNRMPIETIPRL